MSSPEMLEDGGYARRYRAAWRVGQSWLMEFREYQAAHPDLEITLDELSGMHLRYSIAVQTMKDVHAECMRWLAVAEPAGEVRLRLIAEESRCVALRLDMADTWGPQITATLALALRRAPDLFRAALVPVVGPNQTALEVAIADVLEDMALEEAGEREDQLA
jgi:hypothetical protein